MAEINKRRLGLLGAPTYPMLREATQNTLFEIIQDAAISYDYNKAQNVLTLTDSGSRIIFRPVDDFERLRGTNLAWFGLDELTYAPEAAWLRLEARLRDPKASHLCGFAAWTPRGYDWVYRKFVVTTVKGYRAVLAKAFENKHLLSQVPDFYERLKSSYDETLYRQEALGQYLNLKGGTVYKEFDRREHVRDLALDRNRQLLWALDFNVDPMSSVVVQIIAGKVRVLDEIVIRHASTMEACEEFAKRFPNHSSGIVVYADASGNSQQTTGSSDSKMIRDFFRTHGGSCVEYRIPRSNPMVRDRVALMNAKLRAASGEIDLLVDGKCKELIKDFEEVSYREQSNAIDKDKDRARTHLSDALGYLMWQEFRPMAPIGEHGRRLI